MINRNIREDVALFIKEQIANSPILSPIQNDIGVLSLMGEFDYKIDTLINRTANMISEYHNPTAEPVLLSELLYKNANIRFKSPIEVKATIKSGVDVTLQEHQKFSDGVNTYLLKDGVALEAGVETEIALFQGKKKTVRATANESLYLKLFTEETYKNVFDIKAYHSNGTELLCSQQFTDDMADCMYEVTYNSNIQVCVRLNNIQGKNIKKGEEVYIEVFTCGNIDTAPVGLGIVGSGYDLIIENITVSKNYIPYMSIEEMIQELKYNKNPNNTLVFNENFWSLIMRSNISGISALKVWQQREEELEVGVDTCNINKVFVCYVSDGNVNSEIEELISKTVYGRIVVFKIPVIVELTVAINITNNISKKIPTQIIDTIKNKIAKLYDDVHDKISEGVIYRIVFDMLKGYNTDIAPIAMSNKGNYKNNKFYNISKDNISINVIERGY